jgi:hypothetical protein
MVLISIDGSASANRLTEPVVVIDGCPDPPAYRQAHASRNQGRRRYKLVVVERFAHASAHFERIAKTVRGEKAGSSRVARQHGVRGDCRAVDDDVDLPKKACQRCPGHGREIGEAAQHRLGGIGRGRKHLVHVRASVRTQQQVVGEGAADINPNAITHVVPKPLSDVFRPAATRWRATSHFAPAALHVDTIASLGEAGKPRPDGTANELLEQCKRVVQTDLRVMPGATPHAPALSCRT